MLSMCFSQRLAQTTKVHLSLALSLATQNNRAESVSSNKAPSSQESPRRACRPCQAGDITWPSSLLFSHRATDPTPGQGQLWRAGRGLTPGCQVPPDPWLWSRLPEHLGPLPEGESSSSLGLSHNQPAAQVAMPWPSSPPSVPTPHLPPGKACGDWAVLSGLYFSCKTAPA